MKWTTCGRILVVFVTISVHGLGIDASADNLYRFRPGIHISNERPVSTTQRADLVNGLRNWTGLTELGFNPDGDLVLGDRTKVTCGSETARALIIKAADSSDSFLIGQYSNSSSIAFAQVEDTDRYIDGAGNKHLVWELRLDFADFAELDGDKEVLASFDPVASLVHELSHAVKGYFDSVGRDDQLGECEAYVNVMRVELGLPKRVHYFPLQRRTTKPDGLTFVQGELGFVAERSQRHLTKEVVLTFDVERVFDLSRAKSRSEVEASLGELRRAFR